MRDGCLILPVLIAATLWGCAGSRSPQDAEKRWDADAMDHFLASKTFERHMNPYAAIVELLDALETERSSFAIYRALARNYWRIGKPERAMEYGRRAVQAAPDVAESRKFLVMLLLRTGDLRSTAAELEAILTLEPWDYTTYSRLADVYLQSGEAESMVRTLDRMDGLGGLPTDIRLKIAGLYARLGRMQAAKESYRRIAVEDPSLLEAWAELGEMLKLEGNREGAIDVYRQGLRSNPDSGELFGELVDLYVAEEMLGQVVREEIEENPEFCYYLGLALMAKGYDAEAEQVFQHIISRPDSDPDLWIEIGRVYYSEGEYALAAKAFERAAKVLPENGDVLDFLGATLRRLKRWPEAIAAFRKALALQPENTSYLFDLGSTLERSGAFEEAVATFEGLLEIDPEHPYALNYLGYMFADRGIRLEESVRLLEEAVEKEPSNGAFMDSLGWAYFRLGEMEKAETYLDQAIQLLDEEDSEENAVIFQHVGDVAQTLGKMDKARMYWEKSLEMDSDNQEVRRKLENLERSSP